MVLRKSILDELVRKNSLSHQFITIDREKLLQSALHNEFKD